jgi:hypothetical protein
LGRPIASRDINEAKKPHGHPVLPGRFAAAFYGLGVNMVKMISGSEVRYLKIVMVE